MLPNELQKLLAYVVPYRWSLLFITLFLLVESATALAIPWLAGQLASPLLRLTADARFALVPLTLLLLGLCAMQALSSFGVFYLASRTTELLVADLRGYVYDHLQSLPLRFYHERRHGDVLALLTRDVEVLSWFFSGSLLNILPSLLTFVGAIVLMVRIDLELGALAIILIPVGFLLVKFLGRRLRGLSQQLAQEYATAVAMAEDHLRLLPVIKAFTAEEQTAARYGMQNRRIVALNLRQLRLRASLGPLIQFLTAIGIILLLWLASQKVLAGILTADALVSFFLYGLLLIRPLSIFATTYGQFQQTRGAIVRLLEALQASPEPLSSDGPSMPRVRGTIEFRGITFAYPGRPGVFHELHWQVAAGAIVALTGPNGAGKSTLVHLLMRFLTPQAGHIFIDGSDISTVSLRSLRQQIGLVPQHALLFNGTIRENLAYGNPSATQADIEAAARVARAHGFIQQLPAGYDTLVGDSGVKLSGGQRQRLCLARTVLKDPPILLLDEATAMYDPEGEREMLCAVQDWLRQRTVILITHHPTVLALADRVVRLEHGVISDLPATQVQQGAAHVRH